MREKSDARVAHSVFIEVQILDVGQIFALGKILYALVSEIIIIQVQPVDLFQLWRIP